MWKVPAYTALHCVAALYLSKLSANKARDKIGHALRHANATREDATGEQDTNPSTLSSALCHLHAANQGAAQAISPFNAVQYDATLSPAIGGSDATVFSLKMAGRIDNGNGAIASKQWSTGVAPQVPSIHPAQCGTEREECRKRSQIPEAPTSLIERRSLNFAMQEPQSVFPFAALHPNPSASGRNHLPGQSFIPNDIADSIGSVAFSVETDSTPTSGLTSIPLCHTEDCLRPRVFPSPGLHSMNHTLADEARKSSAIVEMPMASTKTLHHPLDRGQTNSRQLATLTYPGHATSNTTQAIGVSFDRCMPSSFAWGTMTATQEHSFDSQAYFPSVVADSSIASASVRRDTAMRTLTLTSEDQQENDVIGSDLERMMKEPIQEWGETPSSSSSGQSRSMN